MMHVYGEEIDSFFQLGVHCPAKGGHLLSKGKFEKAYYAFFFTFLPPGPDTFRHSSGISNSLGSIKAWRSYFFAVLTS